MTINYILKLTWPTLFMSCIKGNGIIDRPKQQLLPHYLAQIAIHKSQMEKPLTVRYPNKQPLKCLIQTKMTLQHKKGILSGLSGIAVFSCIFGVTQSPGVSLQGQRQKEGWSLCPLTDVCLPLDTSSSIAL